MAMLNNQRVYQSTLATFFHGKKITGGFFQAVAGFLESARGHPEQTPSGKLTCCY